MLPLPDKVPVPNVVVPFLKVTVPVGAVPVTAAVSRVALPTATGLTLATTVVAVVTVAAANAGASGAMSVRKKKLPTKALRIR